MLALIASLPLHSFRQRDWKESPENIHDLGEYGQSTHFAYLERQSSRLGQIQSITSRVAASLHSSGTEDLEVLAQLSYQVRKSSTFLCLLHQIGDPRFKSARTWDHREIIERIGQLGKFARAASTITQHLKRMVLLDITITVSGRPAGPIEISELSQRMASQLRHRGGQRYSSFRDSHLQSMINRWPRYREHAEVQLVIFYEENANKHLHTPYIDCNKQSCFLCFHFIAQLGRFTVGGCHQSLYSLWTIRDIVKCGDAASATKIKRSLASLSAALERMVEDRRKPFWRNISTGTGKESVPNLSRTSLAPSALLGTMADVQKLALDSSPSAESHNGAASNHLSSVLELEDRVSNKV